MIYKSSTWLCGAVACVFLMAASPLLGNHQGVCGTPDWDGDGHDALWCGGDDCDDHDPDRYPGNVEVCDDSGRDEDCDGSTFGFRDADGDGYADHDCCNNEPGSGLVCGNDCDDAKGDAHPYMIEVCNGRDNNCDGVADDSLKATLYEDQDDDGWAASGAATQMMCPADALGVPGWTPRTGGGDCNDGDHLIHPRQREICNGIDDDCDGKIDEGLRGLCS